MQPGFYSLTGSALPKSCPAWGLCKGRAFDEENEVPGMLHTCFLLLTTCYILLATYYWVFTLLATYYLQHTACYFQVPGSQPIGVQGGKQVAQQSVTVQTEHSVVEQTVELLATESSEVNETAFRLHIATVYGVPLEAISLSLTKQEGDSYLLFTTDY